LASTTAGSAGAISGFVFAGDGAAPDLEEDYLCFSLIALTFGSNLGLTTAATILGSVGVWVRSGSSFSNTYGEW